MSWNVGLLRISLACAAMICGVGEAACQSTVSMEKPGPRTYRLQGSFSVEASSRAAWEVLTDYDGMSRFVSSLRISRVIERHPDRILLMQEAAGKAFLISRKVRVVLQVREGPMREILFEDVSHQDFEFYRGAWKIDEDGASLRLSYELDAKRKFAAPDFVAKQAFKKNAKNLLEQVRSEIVRRSVKAILENGL